MKRFVFAVFVLVLCIAGLRAQDQVPAITGKQPDYLGDSVRQAPAWLLRNWGRAARLDHQLSDAFLLLNRSLEKDPLNPETLAELALAYVDSGDSHQAREQLERALANRARLNSNDSEYFILYQLADIHRQSNERQSDLEYETILLEIVSHDEEFMSRDEFSVNLRKSIRDNLFILPNDGGTSLDRMLRLYRIQDSFSREAHLELGLYYVHGGRYDDALDHLLFAVLKPYTRLIERMRIDDPLYSFENSRQFFSFVSRRSEWIRYLQISRFDEALYYLASAVYGVNPGLPAVYRGIWGTVGFLPFESEFKQKAASQLKNPGREEILFGSAQFREEVNR